MLDAARLIDENFGRLHPGCGGRLGPVGKWQMSPYAPTLQGESLCLKCGQSCSVYAGIGGMTDGEATLHRQLEQLRSMLSAVSVEQFGERWA